MLTMLTIRAIRYGRTDGKTDILYEYAIKSFVAKNIANVGLNCFASEYELT